MPQRKFWIIAALSGVVILAAGAFWLRDSLAMLQADCHPWLVRCQVTDSTPQQ
jgi:hypothetical protein